MNYLNCNWSTVVKKIQKVLPKDGIFQISE